MEAISGKGINDESNMVDWCLDSTNDEGRRDQRLLTDGIEGLRLACGGMLWPSAHA
jgi:hypothetical protein